MKFKALQKELKGIKYSVVGDWDIRLPFETHEAVQKIIAKCREHLLVDWHVFYDEPTEIEPEPEIRMTWDRKNASTECEVV